MAIDSPATLGAPGPQAGASASVELAGWWTRAAAWLLDGLALGAIVFAMGLVLGLVLLASGHRHIDRSTGNALSLAIGLPLALAYAPLLVVRRGMRNGQTLGKQALRIRVVHDSGEPIDMGIALRRELVGRQIPTLVTWGIYGLFDYLWPLGERENRCLHDKLARTRVVRVPQVPAPGPPRAHRPAPPAEPPAPGVEPVRGWLPPSAGG
jgi:uncharacterized RDD family membrane protein YckC